MMLQQQKMAGQFVMGLYVSGAAIKGLRFQKSKAEVLAMLAEAVVVFYEPKRGSSRKKLVSARQFGHNKSFNFDWYAFANRKVAMKNRSENCRSLYPMKYPANSTIGILFHGNIIIENVPTN